MSSTPAAVQRICHPERSESAAQRAIRAVEGPLPPTRSLRSRGRRMFETALAIAREIFDESAYDRFLTRNGLAHSRENYAAFCREHSLVKAHCPRCC